MNYTQNYQLPQWVETDRILMDDFNDMNEALDEAIFSRLGPAEVIQQLAITRGMEVGDVTLDFSTVDWSKWSLAMLEYRCMFNSNGVEGKSASMYLEIATDEGTTTLSIGGQSPAAATTAVLFPFRDAARPISAITFPGGKLVFGAELYQDILRVRVGSNYANLYNYLDGTGALTLYGIH